MLSIIIPSINPVRFNRISAHYQQLLATEPHEIIGIHDAKSLAQSYNLALNRARGEILLFSHDDIEFWTPHFLPRLKNHLSHFDAVGIAGTNHLIGPKWILAGPPHTFGYVAHAISTGYRVVIFGTPARAVPNIQALDGLFLAFHRHVIEAVRWDDQLFTGFHLYDLDCTYRAFRAGFRLAAALDLPVLHMSEGNWGEDWKRYAHLFMEKHKATLAQPTTRTVHNAFVDVPTKEEAMSIMEAISNWFP